MTAKPTPEERFWPKVDKDGPLPRWAPFLGRCWLWTAGLYRSTGYGQFHPTTNGGVGAHRFSYELHGGSIPKGFHLDHLCRVKACVNPAHLEAVTPRENTLRGQTPAAVNAAKTHCKRGHEFTPENTYVNPNRPNTRACRQCHRDGFPCRSTA